MDGWWIQPHPAVEPKVDAVVRVNPVAVEPARQSDARRRAQTGRRHSSWLRENMDTADRQPTTAGSTALAASKPERDAFPVARLRDAGAVVPGKANLSIWWNFRSSDAIAGRSATGGQTRNPCVLDRSPCGSSSGSAAATAASLAVVTIGTDSDGPVVRPAAGALPADPRAALKRDALRGKRIGVWRKGHTGLDPDVDRVFDAAVAKLRDLGATVAEGADVPGTDPLHRSRPPRLRPRPRAGHPRPQGPALPADGPLTGRTDQRARPRPCALDLENGKSGSGAPPRRR
ncbi:amidase family protein [Actinosynnema sp. NPDC050436]|uniref:amidase family protein n=1 Tax=Actinosynnema sp. NPDC050436 TaxID=3155659 RepID=UPI00340CA40B